MNLIFISTGKYPDQHAAAIRHSTIAQGCIENGHRVHFLLLSPQDWDTPELAYKGADYESLIKSVGSHKIVKYWYFVGGLIKLRRRVKEIHQHTTVDAMVVYTPNNLVIYSALQICKKLNIKIFHERTELPYVVGKSNSIAGKLIYNHYLKKLIPKFDGLFVISDKLNDFLRIYNSKIKKILTVVDTDFFNTSTVPVYNYPYIAYCGKMKGNKDGVPVMIKSFAELIKHYPAYKLVLIGDNTDKQAIADTLHTIEQLRLQDRVIFTGLVPRQTMPNLLGNAALLAVSKPNNEQNSGNFPIKVGEYLSTGVPVVVTKVGEIPAFIKDGESGFLAEPDSVESFYLKLHQGLGDYKKALEIGANGRKLAKKFFDYKIQAKAMTDYIEEIIMIHGN